MNPDELATAAGVTVSGPDGLGFLRDAIRILEEDRGWRGHWPGWPDMVTTDEISGLYSFADYWSIANDLNLGAWFDSKWQREVDRHSLVTFGAAYVGKALVSAFWDEVVQAYGRISSPITPGDALTTEEPDVIPA